MSSALLPGIVTEPKPEPVRLLVLTLVRDDELDLKLKLARFDGQLVWNH